jgi:hypothetical protein
MKFHAVFSLLMEAMMVALMTLVVTLVNLGPGPGFLAAWGKVFVIAYVVAVPVIFFLAPMARKMTARLLGVKA